MKPVLVFLGAFFLLTITFPVDTSGEVILKEKPGYLTRDSLTISTSFPDLKDLLDSAYGKAQINDCVETNHNQLPPDNGKLIRLDLNGRTKIALTDDKKSILYVINLQRLSADSYIYINPDEFLFDSGFFYLNVVIDDNLYVRDGLLKRDFGIWDIGQDLIDIFNAEGKERFFSLINSEVITYDDRILSGVKIFPNCALICIRNDKELLPSNYDWSFDVLEDSALVSLLLLDKDQMLIRVFFNDNLLRGKYFMLFSRIDMKGKSLNEGEYYFLLRIGSYERIERFQLVE